MIKRHNATCLFTLFFLLCFLCPPISAADKISTSSGTQTGGKAIWAWADKSDSEYAVFISRQVGETWDKPQKISTNEGLNIVPAVINTSGEDLMVVWSNFIGRQAQLRYRQVKDGLWSEEKEYYTGLSSNMAPAVAVDGAGVIWLVWAGFNGISDEIYYTTWNGTSFVTATAITANNVPDILPVLGIDDATGTPWVQWQQYSGKGYVKLESAWNGSAWSEPLLVPAEESSTAGQVSTGATLAVVLKRAGTSTKDVNPDKQTLEETTVNQLEIEIPAFITNPGTASIHIPGYTVQSLPIRSIETMQNFK